MAYDDDDDLFGEEFDFVDEDDDAAEDDSAVEEKPAAKPRKRPPAREKTPAKPPAKRAAKPAAGAAKREPRREAPPEPAPPAEPVAAFDEPPIDEPIVDEAPEEGQAQPSGPPADHVVHIYEHGQFKRTIDRKFTDEQAVSFAEEFTRTGKPYGRYAIATPDDEEPAATFAEAAKG